MTRPDDATDCGCTDCPRLPVAAAADPFTWRDVALVFVVAGLLFGVVCAGVMLL